MALATNLYRSRKSDIERLLPAFTNAGIATRYSCVPPDWYERDHGWAERSQLYVENALDLLERATRDCLARVMPGARVLFLVVELCALTFRKGDLSKSNIIAAALFGDGAAAALVGPEASA